MVDHTDSFIEEVTEEVRRDRLFAAFRKYGWIGVLAIVALVGGSALNEWQKARASAEAQAFGDAVLAALSAEDPKSALAAVPATVSVAGAQQAVLRLMTAAQAAEAGASEAALADLRAISADAALPGALRDLARIKAATLPGAPMPAVERKAELEALAQPGAPYRLLALEALAIDALAAGDKAAALAKAREILAEDGVTAGLQQRASELIVALGGDPAAS